MMIFIYAPKYSPHEEPGDCHNKKKHPDPCCHSNDRCCFLWMIPGWHGPSCCRISFHRRKSHSACLLFSVNSIHSQMHTRIYRIGSCIHSHTVHCKPLCAEFTYLLIQHFPDAFSLPLISYKEQTDMPGSAYCDHTEKLLSFKCAKEIQFSRLKSPAHVLIADIFPELFDSFFPIWRRYILLKYFPHKIQSQRQFL